MTVLYPQIFEIDVSLFGGLFKMDQRVYTSRLFHVDIDKGEISDIDHWSSLDKEQEKPSIIRVGVSDVIHVDLSSP